MRHVQLHYRCRVHTYRFDNNIKSHQNLVDSGQKNIRSVMDQSNVTSEPDPPTGYPEIDLTSLTAFQTLNHSPKKRQFFFQSYICNNR